MFQTLATHVPTAQNPAVVGEVVIGEVLGLFRAGGLLPPYMLKASTRFHNINNNGMSVVGPLISTTTPYDPTTIAANPTIAARPMVTMRALLLCVEEITDTSCNNPLTVACARARGGCATIM